MGIPSGADGPEPEDLRELVVLHREDAYRLARYLVGRHGDAEDLAQTAIANVLARVDHIERPESVKAYLMIAVRNLWRNRLREQSRRRVFASDSLEVVSDELGPEERTILALDTAVAHRAYESLSDTSREVIRLRYIVGLDYEHVARELGIRTGAARQRAHRARDELLGACIEVEARGGDGACGRMRLLLGRYYRGRLTKGVRSEVESHLSECRHCAACYDELVNAYGRSDRV